MFGKETHRAHFSAMGALRYTAAWVCLIALFTCGGLGLERREEIEEDGEVGNPVTGDIGGESVPPTGSNSENITATTTTAETTTSTNTESPVTTSTGATLVKDVSITFPDTCTVQITASSGDQIIASTSAAPRTFSIQQGQLLHQTEQSTRVGGHTIALKLTEVITLSLSIRTAGTNVFLPFSYNNVRLLASAENIMPVYASFPHMVVSPPLGCTASEDTSTTLSLSIGLVAFVCLICIWMFLR
jgi:hypothetical protein